VIELTILDEKSSIYAELIVGVELSLVLPLCLPRIRAFTLHNEHAMVESRAVVLTPHLHLWRRRVVARVSRKDDIPELLVA
jgi:hypothetical protein